MKEVTEKEWREKAAGLAEWRKNKTTPPNLDLYKRIVGMVHVGKSVADVGCGQCHLKQCLPYAVEYLGIDPFPLSEIIIKADAEYYCNMVEVGHEVYQSETVFMLSALDNVWSVDKSLKGLKALASKNIVILTGIGIPPDAAHTVQVDKIDLVSVLGEPHLEVEISPRLFLFEFKV